MTLLLNAADVAPSLRGRYPDAVLEAKGSSLLVRRERLVEVARFLRDTDGLDFDYPAMVTAIDWWDYFDVVYYLHSLTRNHSLYLKTRAYGRELPAVPSLVGVWRGCVFQEREVYDLMGIRFEGHPNLKRILLWEGFEGHPLRKDFIG